MRKYRLAALLLAAVMTFSAAAVSCSSKNSDTSISSTFVPETKKKSVDGKLEGLADNEVSANISQEASANETAFVLNRVIDSGMKNDKGGRYIYLDVTINNATEKEYELTTINNFYILFSDKNEAHFDVRTQLYATKHLANYAGDQFKVPAKGSFSGIIGGFIVDKDKENFTVCFFPSQDDEHDKSNVIKVDVTAEDILQLNPADTEPTTAAETSEAPAETTAAETSAETTEAETSAAESDETVKTIIDDSED